MLVTPIAIMGIDFLLSLRNSVSQFIYDPRYGVWWPASGHLKNARYYNDIWKEFFTEPRSRTEILNKGREMMQKHGIQVNY